GAQLGKGGVALIVAAPALAVPELDDSAESGRQTRANESIADLSVAQHAFSLGGFGNSRDTGTAVPANVDLASRVEIPQDRAVPPGGVNNGPVAALALLAFLLEPLQAALGLLGGLKHGPGNVQHVHLLSPFQGLYRTGTVCLASVTPPISRKAES